MKSCLLTLLLVCGSLSAQAQSNESVAIPAQVETDTVQDFRTTMAPTTNGQIQQLQLMKPSMVPSRVVGLIGASLVVIGSVGMLLWGLADDFNFRNESAAVGLTLTAMVGLIPLLIGGLISIRPRRKRKQIQSEIDKLSTPQLQFSFHGSGFSLLF